MRKRYTHVRERIKRLLIANRGEPSMRAIRTCRELGIEAAVVYYGDDARSDWVAAADYALRLHRSEGQGESPYVDARQIVEVARSHGCDAVWPGWGFLSEEASFAEEVARAGLVWVGPPPAAMSLLGSKLQASSLASRAGFATIQEVKLLEGQGAETLPRMPFPLVIKPAYGGGGKGHHVVASPEGLRAGIDAAVAQARNLYGKGDLVIQAFLSGARHIELQLLRDAFGSTCIVGARDCSIQRRNQKIIEEAPAYALPAKLLAQASRTAVKLCANAGYTSAGTVEMLLHGGELFFLEMNTRLQVEHPVTEESVRLLQNGIVSRLDLLAEMLSIACGGKLSFRQKEIILRGCAIEARIYAEDPEGGFVPTPGRVYFVRFPHADGVRIDSAIVGPEETVSRHFDPMIGKLIVSAPTRDAAVARLGSCLAKTVILGIQTNIDFLRRVVSHPDFQSGEYRTDFIAATMPSLAPSPERAHLAASIAGIVAYRADGEAALAGLLDRNVVDLEEALLRFPSGGIDYTMAVRGELFEGRVHQLSEGRYAVRSGDQWIFLDVDAIGEHVYAIRDVAGKSYETYLHAVDGSVQMVLEGEYFQVDVAHEGTDHQVKRDPHAAPCAGKLLRICVAAGARVEAGEELYVVEAMKMENRIRAAAAGLVEEVCLAPGSAVEAGDLVVRVASEREAAEAPAPQKQLRPVAPQDEMICRIFATPATLLEEGHEVEERWAGYRELLIALPELYFKGYDIPSETVAAAFALAIRHEPLHAAAALARVVEGFIASAKLREEDTADATLDFVKRGRRPTSPSAFQEALAAVLRWYNLDGVRDPEAVRAKLPRILAGIKGKELKQLQVIVALIETVANHPPAAKELTPPIVALLSSGLLEADPPLKQRLLSLLEALDREAYYRVRRPPVAIEYLDEYERFVANPLATLGAPELAAIRARAEAPRVADEDDFSALPLWLKVQVEQWFDGFRVSVAAASAQALEAGVHLFEVQSHKEPSDRRLIAICMVENEVVLEVDGHPVLPRAERAAVEAYRLIAQYEVLGGRFAYNHVFVILPSNIVLRWIHAGEERETLSAAQLRAISGRIVGFARGLRILATEVVLHLEAEGSLLPHLIEIRHTGPVGLMSRPPYPMSERMPELAQGTTRFLDEKQQRLGKLINRDRARILFDDGRFEELSFPEVDEDRETPIGLKVYRGRIGGVPAYAYAGDFSIRGGALGEREGKKLAASVVLAYAAGAPLVGIHDGAGADIRGSVASLGWAGAYFGAIANTGGFSSRERFRVWLEGQHERGYFEKVLRHFGLRHVEAPPEDRRFVHIHLNIGAMVGMLVYGASISAMSIMIKHPEVYRVLTGSATVQRVLGEKTTNYGLGGAPTHGRSSGDIDLVAATEEEAIARARQVVSLLMPRKVTLRHRAAAPAGRMLAAESLSREQLTEAFDRGSFIETRGQLKGTSSLVTGYGALEGTPVGVGALLTGYGVRNARGLKKTLMLYAGCQEFGLPLIVIAREKWYGIPEGAVGTILYLRSECARLFATLAVPRITIAVGPRALDETIHHISDICCYVGGDAESAYDLSRAEMNAHLFVPSVAAGLARVARLLPYLTRRTFTVEEGTAAPTLALPERFSEPYNMRAFLGALFDPESFFELFERDGQPLVVGFATMGGRVVGVIADDPMVGSGAQTVYSLGKFTRMNRLCERFGIPLVELNDSPAFQPGSKQERLGIQGEGGKSIREECLRDIPRLAVTLRQNYGGRFIHANLKTLGPGREALICEGARVGVMGAEGAIGVLHGKRLLAMEAPERDREYARLVDEYVREYLDPRRAVELGYASKIVPLAKLRPEMDKWVRKAYEKEGS